MKYCFLLAAICMLSLKIQAQVKPRFSTQNAVGLLVGGTGQAPLVETINGVSYRNWFTGIGTGIDWYSFRSVPLFISGARYFPVSPQRKFLLSSGLGINFPWVKSGDYLSNGWYTYYSDYKKGVYWNAGLGYRLNLGKQQDALLLHLGYNNKTYKQAVKTVSPCLIPPCPETTESYKHSLNTISLRVGWGF